MLLVAERMDPFVVNMYRGRRLSYEQLTHHVRKSLVAQQVIIQELAFKVCLSGNNYDDNSDLNEERLKPYFMRQIS
eukprot:7785263-Karenia_brevis.AAC.1